MGSLADLGGKAAPFSDDKRGAYAAEGEFHHYVVTAHGQEHAQGRVVACLVAQVVVDELDVVVELADVLGLEAAQLPFEHHVAVKSAVVEEQIHEELTVTARNRDLGADEREAGAQFAQEAGEVGRQSLGQVALPNRVSSEEVEDKRVFDDVRFLVRFGDCAVEVSEHGLRSFVQSAGDHCL
ncbi:MAG: hypothetical protein ABSA02_39040 [Trebonia sp.]